MLDRSSRNYSCSVTLVAPEPTQPRLRGLQISTFRTIPTAIVPPDPSVRRTTSAPARQVASVWSDPVARLFLATLAVLVLVLGVVQLLASSAGAPAVATPPVADLPAQVLPGEPAPARDNLPGILPVNVPLDSATGEPSATAAAALTPLSQVAVIPASRVTVAITGPEFVDETGGDAPFTVAIANKGTSAISIASLRAEPFGELAGTTACRTGTILAPGTACGFETTLRVQPGAPGAVLTGTFMVGVTPSSGPQNGAAPAPQASSAAAQASVGVTLRYADVKPSIAVTESGPSGLPETGGDGRYIFVVLNDGRVPVTFDALTADPFGPLPTGSCTATSTLAPAARCTVEALLRGPAGRAGTTLRSVFRATVRDAQGNTFTGETDQSLTYVDVLPSVAAAAIGPSGISAAGGSATFTMRITNSGAVASIVDSIEANASGSVAGSGGCALGVTLSPGAGCSAEIVLSLPAGTVGGAFAARFQVTVHDADGNAASGAAGQAVPYVPTLPVPPITTPGGTTIDPTPAPGAEVPPAAQVDAPADQVPPPTDTVVGKHVVVLSGTQVGTMIAVFLIGFGLAAWWLPRRRTTGRSATVSATSTVSAAGKASAAHASHPGGKPAGLRAMARALMPTASTSGIRVIASAACVAPSDTQIAAAAGRRATEPGAPVGFRSSIGAGRRDPRWRIAWGRGSTARTLAPGVAGWWVPTQATLSAA